MERIVEFIYGLLVLAAIAIGIASVIKYGEVPGSGEPERPVYRGTN
jgi:hypothetical protein